MARLTTDLRCRDDIEAKPLPIRFWVMLALVTAPIWYPVGKFLVSLCRA